MVTETGRALAFGTLLRRHRRVAGLTQEALAERAGVSVRTISNVERGACDTPHKDTGLLLADALGLRDADRAVFLSAADRRHASASLAPAGRSTSPAVTCATAPPFVGRQRELALLERHLAGQGPPVLLLVGEPGIGKTRLLHAAIPHAVARGWRVLAGGCQRRGGQEPYAPLLEALRQHVREQPPNDLRAHLRGCAWLVRLLPELADGPIPPLPSWTASPEQERRLMVEAIWRLLDNIAGPAGTLFLLDDLQWAGQDALDLIGTLIRSPATTPVRIIAAYRDTEVPQEAPLAALLADLAHAGLTVRRAIGPLAATEAARLLDGLLGAVDGGAARHGRLLRRTGGIPFFLVSCAQALRQGEDQDGEAAPWDVAQSVRQRIAVLPEAAREVLRAAAVVGRVAERRLLAAMVTRPGDQLLDALDAVCRAGLLEEENRTGYRFAHDMVREVVEGDLSWARRAALHQRAGEALESLSGVYSVEILAYHYVRSDAIDKAVLYLEQAGDRAAAQLAHLAAEAHYRDLLRLLESLGRRYEAARVYAKLGLRLKRTGRASDCMAALRQVAEVYSGSTEAKPWEQFATAESVRGQPFSTEANAVSVDTVLSLMDEHEQERTRGVLYLAYAYYSGITSRPQRSVAVTERAVELARRLQDRALLAQALESRSMALFMVGRRDEAFAAAREALHLCEVSGDLALLSDVLVALVFTHVHRGEFSQGTLYNDRSLEIAVAIGDTFAAAWAFERRAWSAKHTGDWEQAHVDLAHALRVAPDLAHDPWFCCMRGELCLVQGAWDDASTHFEHSIAAARSLGLVPAQVCTQVFLAELDVLQGRPDAALTRLHAAMAQDQGEYTPIILVWAALSYLQLGDVDQATAASQQAARGALEADDRLILSEALPVQALVAIARRQWEEAEQALEEGLALTRRIGYPYMEAQILHAYGWMHIQKAEVKPARARLESALTIFHRLGARKDTEQAEQLLSTL